MRDIILTIIVIFLSVFINHQVYGNSNVTMSNYEVVKDLAHKQIIKQRSKPLADYMYGRIKYYQQFDNWWERKYMFFKLYEALQNMDLDKE